MRKNEKKQSNAKATNCKNNVTNKNNNKVTDNQKTQKVSNKSNNNIGFENEDHSFELDDDDSHSFELR